MNRAVLTWIATVEYSENLMLSRKQKRHPGAPFLSKIEFASLSKNYLI